jgi:hypothetical protein
MGLGLRTLLIIGLAVLSHAQTTVAISAAGLWMDADAISKSFNNATVAGSYANGRPFQEHYRADGRVEYVERGMNIGGRWSVTSGTLCTIYDTDPTGGCFRVAKVSANCFEFYFVARTEEAAPGDERDRPKWTARGSITRSSGVTRPKTWALTNAMPPSCNGPSITVGSATMSIRIP